VASTTPKTWITQLFCSIQLNSDSIIAAGIQSLLMNRF
jgi:hypothetical protein